MLRVAVSRCVVLCGFVLLRAVVPIVCDVSQLVPSAVSLGAQQLHQVKRMIGGTCRVRLLLKLKMGKIQGFLWATSEARDNPGWANFGK